MESGQVPELINSGRLTLPRNSRAGEAMVLFQHVWLVPQIRPTLRGPPPGTLAVAYLTTAACGTPPRP